MPDRTVARMGEVRIPSEDELHRITERGVAEIVPREEFVSALKAAKHLRLKQGFDPTRPVITLGWTVGLRKLRLLQDLGHTVVVIIGDWTARIGDPSGKSETRPMLTEEEVKTNSDAILEQFFKILDPAHTEIRRQTEWFDEFSLADIVRLASRFTVAQILQRDDFSQRFAEHTPIGIHELLYPLLQAYDSYAIEADVEFGGTDQKFNNLVGRELQRMLGQKAGPAGLGQAVFLVPLLVGLDGTKKMSQSLDNYVAIDMPAHDMYGKLMSIPDTLIGGYFELLTDVPDEEIAYIRKSIEDKSVNPMEHKRRLARDIVAEFHGGAAGEEAQDEFARVFQQREAPITSAIEVRWRDLPFADALLTVGISPAEVVARKGAPIKVATLLASALAMSMTLARSLVEQGAVEIDGKPSKSRLPNVKPGSTIRVGSHRFIRIVDSDSSSEGGKP